MAAFRALLADDEELALTRLRKVLEGAGEVTVVGVARDGEQAVEMVGRLQPDLLFLDVEMPRLNGFEVVGRLDPRPLVVFVTAHRRYRDLAFEHEAVDCLAKPVAPEDLRRTLGRIERLCETVCRICHCGR